jgi:hypothetical protein
MPTATQFGYSLWGSECSDTEATLRRFVRTELSSGDGVP